MEKKSTGVPECVGFIMDGNRRWATERGLSAHEGHAHGFEALKHVIEAVRTAGIPHMVCYAFSTENWNRTPAEVQYLMEFFAHALRDVRQNITNGQQTRVRFIGERTRFDSNLQKEMASTEAEADPKAPLTVWVALSYGGRAEIVDAVNRAVEKGEAVDEETFGTTLWTDGMPDPDLIIRTGGEERLSNFLLWQSAYSELFFTKTYWPDFGEAEFQSILEQYGTRQRRRGT